MFKDCVMELCAFLLVTLNKITLSLLVMSIEAKQTEYRMVNFLKKPTKLVIYTGSIGSNWRQLALAPQLWV